VCSQVRNAIRSKRFSSFTLNAQFPKHEQLVLGVQKPAADKQANQPKTNSLLSVSGTIVAARYDSQDRG
jgi:hypothetical protein